jgi:hypothetical protein
MEALIIYHMNIDVNYLDNCTDERFGQLMAMTEWIVEKQKQAK